MDATTMKEFEFKCFQALQQQKQLAARYRMNKRLEEVEKQKELKQTLRS